MQLGWVSEELFDVEARAAAGRKGTTGLCDSACLACVMAFSSVRSASSSSLPHWWWVRVHFALTVSCKRVGAFSMSKINNESEVESPGCSSDALTLPIRPSHPITHNYA